MPEDFTTDWGHLAHPLRADDPGANAPPWRDNAYLAFWDAHSAVIGVVHVSTSPNAGGRRARASAAIGRISAELVETLPPASFASESIVFSLDGHVQVRGEQLRADLRLAPRGAAADFTAGRAIPELVEGQPLQHFQQAATVTGTLSVHGADAEVKAVGLRDRTWGFRDESAMWPEYIAVAVDIDGEMLTVLKFALSDGSTKADGFVLGERARRVEDLTEIARDASGLFAGAKVAFSDSERLALRATRRTGGFWVPMGRERTGPTMSAYDEFLEFATSDGRSGHGLVEQGIVRRLT